MYLCGSVKLWRSEFKERYSTSFGTSIQLFEPGSMNVPQNQMHINPDIALFDVQQIQEADALLVYMKNYESNYEVDGPVGTDSSWECGYGYGLKKPIITIIEDLEHLKYFQLQWMVTFTISTFITDNEEVLNVIQNDDRLKKIGCILYKPERNIEYMITEYLKTSQSQQPLRQQL